MKALIDADMLEYQCAFASQYKEKNEEGEDVLVILPFESAKERMDGLIADILEATGATSHVLYLTGKGNFREKIAKKAVYKEQRQEKEKPFHYHNLRAYLTVSLGAVVVDGMEADDAMVIDQMEGYYSDPDTADSIICSRDKDLRQIPGHHYTWECNKQQAEGPYESTPLGFVELDERKKAKKVFGYGLLFFFSQLLTGDAVDNIPGCSKVGPVLAARTLSLKDEAGACAAVIELYRERHADNWEAYLDEQVKLLWMVQTIGPDGPVFYNWRKWA